MPITTPLPAVPQTSDPDNFEGDMDAFLAALPLFQSELNAFASGVSAYGRNALINGGFQVAQRFTSSTAVADDTYALDRWYVLTQTASVNVSQLTDPENGYTHAMRLSQNQASAQRMGFAQILEGKNCKHLRNVSATLSGRVRISNSQAVRYAVLGWTGTEDAPTSDVVNSWTNGSFIAGSFFNSTTLLVYATGSITPSANTWTSLAALTASLDATFNNLIVMIWTEQTAAQNVTLDVDYVQLETGSSATPFERQHIAHVVQDCQRYFQTYDYSAVKQVVLGQAWATDKAQANFYFPKMRAAPTVFSPTSGSGSGQMYFTTSVAGIPSTIGSISATNVSDTSLTFAATGYTGAFTAGNASILQGASTGTVTLKLDAEL